MKNLIFYLFLVVFVSGCAASSKTVKPASAPKAPAPAMESKPMPKTTQMKEEALKVKDAKEMSMSVLPINYAQVTNVISEFLHLNPAEDISGESGFAGTSENNLVVLEIIGTMDNISRVSMNLVYPKDMEAVDADLNNAMMLRFLRNVAPEFKDWSNRIKDILNKFYAMNAGEIKEERIPFDKKEIRLLYDKNMNSISLTVEPK